MSAMTDAPPAADGRFVRDRLAAWIAERRLPEPHLVEVIEQARACYVHLATTDDVIRWAAATGYDVRVRMDASGLSMWLRDAKGSDIWCRLEGVPVPVDVYGPRVALVAP